MPYDRRAIRERLLNTDFAGDGVGVGPLRAAISRLSVGRRLVVELRYCGITRERVGAVVVERYGPRLTGVQAADYLGCQLSAVHDSSTRGLDDLVRILPREEARARLAPLRERAGK